jgi:hypothetical protein
MGPRIAPRIGPVLDRALDAAGDAGCAWHISGLRLACYQARRPAPGIRCCIGGRIQSDESLRCPLVSGIVAQTLPIVAQTSPLSGKGGAGPGTTTRTASTSNSGSGIKRLWRAPAHSGPKTGPKQDRISTQYCSHLSSLTNANSYVLHCAIASPRPGTSPGGYAEAGRAGRAGRPSTRLGPGQVAADTGPTCAARRCGFLWLHLAG